MEYLARDPVNNISLIEPLRLGRAVAAARTDRGVLLDLEGLTMVAADGLDDALELLEARPDFHTLVAAGGTLAGELMDAMELEDEGRCWQAAYLNGTPLPVEGEIRQLDMTWFQPVLDGYSLFHDPAYVADRLKAGVIFGAFADGQLAGFIGEHPEGSMGMLEVFSAYRRRGLGLALESYQINRFLSQGRVPFDQVIVGNEKSLCLQKKLGMTISEDTISWLYRKRKEG